MSIPSRLAIVAIVALALQCGPSATLKQSTPVANLQIYRSLNIRVGGPASQFASTFEFLAADRLRQNCRFDSVYLASAGGGQADLYLDVNLRRVDMDSGSLIQIQNVAYADMSIVLTDGVDNELLGSAEIMAKSAKVQVANTDPYTQALTAAADKVAETMVKAGCGLARMERVIEPEPQQPPPPQTVNDAGVVEPTPPTGPSAEVVAQANQLNDDGKLDFRNGDPAAAELKFAEAVRLIQDPRYYFNLCLARESLKKFDSALQACAQVKQPNTSARLIEKADLRIKLIQEKKAQ